MADLQEARADRIDPVWWGLFSAGGFLAAFLVPIHLFVNSIAVPLGWLDPRITGYARMKDLLSHPLVRLYLFALVALPLFHAAHRLRFALQDMGLARWRTPLAVLCYGAAMAGSIWAARVFWQLP